MRDFALDNLTDIVLQEYESKTPSPRFRQIVAALISHLRAFVKEVELTEEEWLKAILFLTGTGQLCDDERQEFILLSDVLGGLHVGGRH